MYEKTRKDFSLFFFSVLPPPAVTSRLFLFPHFLFNSSPYLLSSSFVPRFSGFPHSLPSTPPSFFRICIRVRLPHQHTDCSTLLTHFSCLSNTSLFVTFRFGFVEFLADEKGWGVRGGDSQGLQRNLELCRYVDNRNFKPWLVRCKLVESCYEIFNRDSNCEFWKFSFS